MKNKYLSSEFFSLLEAQELSLKKSLIGNFGGKHLTDKHGQNVEFADFREYQLGDDIRRIDWNAYSRFEKYFIKLFNDERQMHIKVFVDCSASMGADDCNKGDYALALAASLGFLAVNNLDKLSINLIKENATTNTHGVIISKNAFFRGISDLDSVIFEGDAHISEAITKNSSMDSAKNGLCIIISDFMTYNDWKKAVDYLIYSGGQVLIIQVLSEAEVTPSYFGKTNLIDSESLGLFDDKNFKLKISSRNHKSYEKAYCAMIDDIKSFCVSRGAGFVTITTNTPIEKAIFSEYMKAGIL